MTRESHYDNTTILMPVQFILGRAGSGKTHRCVDSIRARLREDAVNGPRLILLVPEQASLQMERTVLMSDDVPCAHRVEVLSFQRLAFRVLEAAGVAQRRALSEAARVMVLRHLIQQHRHELQYYKRVERHGGFVERLAHTMTELIEEDISPTQLDQINKQATSDAARSAKLRDIGLLYQAYLAYLGQDRVDPSQYLLEAQACFDRVAWLTDCEVWVDGFASFSGQEQAALVSLATQAARLEMTVLCDPSSFMQGHATPFDRTLMTMRRLERAFIESGVETEAPLSLHKSPQPRFNTSVSLATLETHFFDDSNSLDTTVASTTDEIDLVRLPDRRSEVEYAVAKIHAWVNQEGQERRYRDIAVIVRELTHYEDLLRSALSSRDIPFFIDRRRPIAQHPLATLFRVLAQLAVDDLSTSTICDLLKTDLLPLSINQADELENYCLAHAVRGWTTWPMPWTAPMQSGYLPSHDKISDEDQAAIDRVNLARVKVVEALSPWMNAVIDDANRSGEDWAELFRDCLRHLHVDETMAAWTETAESDGQLELAGEHRQVWRDMLSFLDDLAFAFHGIDLTVRDVLSVVDSALSSMTLGLAPPMVDQLLVGSIERSRHPQIKAAIVLGFNDGVFPQQPAEDPILNDDDRDHLEAHGITIRPGSARRIADESLLAYIALTRASQSLVITCAMSNHDGKPLRPSPYIETISQCCGVALRNDVDPMQSRCAWNTLDLRDFLDRLPLELRARPAESQDDATMRASWLTVYDVVRQRLMNDPWPGYAFAGLHEQSQSHLSESTIASIIAKPLRTSVTQLESFATCPFQHFSRYRLGLKERVTSPLAKVDVGRLHHAILEDFVKNLAHQHEGFASQDEETMLQGLHQTHERLSGNMLQAGAVSQSRDRYLIERSRSDLSRVVAGQRRAAEEGKAKPKAAELAFGMDADGGLPALEIVTPAGKTVWLRGFIDRVDIAELGDELLGIVVDYKRTRDKKLDLSSAYHGLSLQLLAYLLVLAEHGHTLAGRPIRPIAALYVSLMPKYSHVEHPSKLTARDAVRAGNFLPRGLILSDKFDALDHESGASNWSDHYAFYRNKSGEPGNLDRSDAADDASFKGMMALTKRRLGELADDLFDGCVKIEPIRLGDFSPCSWCNMKSVCRVENGLTSVRHLARISRGEVLQQAKNLSS